MTTDSAAERRDRREVGEGSPDSLTSVIVFPCQMRSFVPNYDTMSGAARKSTVPQPVDSPSPPVLSSLPASNSCSPAAIHYHTHCCVCLATLQGPINRTPTPRPAVDSPAHCLDTTPTAQLDDSHRHMCNLCNWDLGRWLHRRRSSPSSHGPQTSPPPSSSSSSSKPCCPSTSSPSPPPSPAYTS